MPITEKAMPNSFVIFIDSLNKKYPINKLATIIPE